MSQHDVELPYNDFSNLNCSDSWSGASFKCGDKFVILYNASHSNARNESTIMHEISHIILDHEPIIDEQFKHLGLILLNYNEIHENEANWLGGCLQIPFDGLVKALLNHKTYEQIASQYLASIDMVKFRINKSGATQKVIHIKKKYNI